MRGTLRWTGSARTLPRSVAFAVCLLAVTRGATVSGRAQPASSSSTSPGGPVFAAPEARGPLDRLASAAIDLAPDSRHRYDVTLTEGALLVLDVEQLSIDVVIECRGNGARSGIVVDDVMEREGPERVRVIAPAAGAYQIEIRSEPLPGVTAGRYRVVAHEVRPATDDDRARARRRAEAEARLAAIEADLAKSLMVSADRAEAIDQQLDAVVATLTDERMHRQRATAWRLQSIMRLRQLRFDLVRAFNESTTVPWLVGARYGAQRAYALNHLAEGLVRTGEIRRGIEAFREATALPASPLTAAIVRDNLGSALRRVGRYQEALDAHQVALEYFAAHGAQQSVGIVLNRMALVWEEVGDYRQALEVGERALAAFVAAGDVDNQVGVLLNSSAWHMALGEATQARDAIERGGQLTDLERVPYLAAHAAYVLAQVELQQGRTAEAEMQVERAQALWAKTDYLQGQGEALVLLGRLRLESGAVETAIDPLSKGLDVGRRSAQVEVEVSALRWLANADAARGHLADAAARLHEAVTLVEDQRRHIGGPVLRTALLSRRQDVYADLVDVLQLLHHEHPEAGHQDEAFRVSEGGRARSLLDALMLPGQALTAGVASALLARATEARQRLNERHTQRFDAERRKDDAETRRLDDEITRITGEIALADGAIRAAHPAFAALTAPEPLTPAAVQRDVLDQRSVLLEFAVNTERSWLWTITGDEVASFELPGRRVIEPLVRAVIERTTAAHAAGRNEQALGDALGELARHLLGPVAGRFEGAWRDKRLVVVANDVLAYVPFAALIAPGTSAPLVDRHEIVFTPSATVLSTMRRDLAARPVPTKTLAILADPVFEASDPRVASSAVLRDGARRPVESPASASGTSAFVATGRLVPSQLRRTGALTRLPSTRREASAIVALVPPARVSSAFGLAATREWVQKAPLADHRIVHFATHGLIDAEHPELTSLALSLVDEHGRARDGLWRLHEIYDMRLPVDLVVLSACQTALGREMAGEGLLGLTRGFLYAGARRVVATLWQVDDVATAALMSRFYRHLLHDGLPAASALRAAQREIARQPRWASPYYWAGFVLHGDWH